MRCEKTRAAASTPRCSRQGALATRFNILRIILQQTSSYQHCTAEACEASWRRVTAASVLITGEEAQTRILVHWIRQPVHIIPCRSQLSLPPAIQGHGFRVQC